MMKLFLRNIKKGFATNSSSYHSTLILTEEQYNQWKNGELDGIDGTYEEWGEYYETEVTHYTTPNGEKIIVLCEYGYDG